MTVINHIKRRYSSTLMLMILSLLSTFVSSDESTNLTISPKPISAAEKTGQPVNGKVKLLGDDELSKVNIEESPMQAFSSIQENTSYAIEQMQTKYLSPNNGYYDAGRAQTISFTPDKPSIELPEVLTRIVQRNDELRDLLLPEAPSTIEAYFVQEPQYRIKPIVFENISPQQLQSLPELPARLELPQIQLESLQFEPPIHGVHIESLN